MSTKKTLSEKILAEANERSKEKACKLRFKANPMAEIARVQKAVESVAARVPKPSKPISAKGAQERGKSGKERTPKTK